MTVDGREVGSAGKILGLQSAVDAGSVHLTGYAGDIEGPIDQFDFVQACGARHRKRVFDAGGIIVRTPVESELVVGILGANRKMVLAGIDFDMRLLQPLLRV